MLYRCQECDFLGKILENNEDGDYICPDCGSDSPIEYEEMSEEQNVMLNNFLHAGAFVEENYNRDGYAEPCDNDKLLFNRYKDNHYWYTVISCEGNEDWICPGCRYVNRMGYFVSTAPINIPTEGIRYS